MGLKYNGYGANCITMKFATDVQPKVGMLVKMENEMINCAEDGEVFFGVVVGVNGGFVSVQTEGYVEIPFAGESPEMLVGTTMVVAKENGIGPDTQKTNPNYVRTIIMVDEINKKYGIIL